MRTKTKSKAVRDARYALTFGLEAAAVRLGPCVAMRNHAGPGPLVRCFVRQAVIDDEHVLVWDPAHVQSVGAGGGRFDLVSLCGGHHQQQHSIGIDSFAALYGLDLRALADEQALAHEPPLGIRGLAERWAWWASYDPPQAKDNEELDAHLDDLGPVPRVVQGYDLAALQGWVRRRMARAALTWGAAYHDEQAEDVALDLGGPFVTEAGIDDHLTRTLCKAAGWPS